MKLMRLFSMVLVLVLALALFLPGCKKHEIIVNKILVDRLEGAELIPVDRSELEAWAQAALGAQNKLVFRIGSSEGASLTIALSATPDALGQEPRELTIATRWQDFFASTTVAYKSKEKLKDAFIAAVNQDVESLVSAFSRERNMGKGKAQKINEYLSGKNLDDNDIIAALRKVGEDKDQSLAPLVAKVLKGPRMRPSIVALAVLGEIADPKTIVAVTEFAERKPAEVRRHAIEAARKIGGRDAAAWLFTMSTGYDDHEVRNAARLALADVERRLSKNAVAKVAADDLPPAKESRL